MNIPVEFLDRMKALLDKNEYEEFLASFEKPRFFGLRVNTLKISVEQFLKISPFKLKPIPWTKDGFYYEEGEYPGKHPYYHAGLYYIQEPSAMLPVEVLNPEPGERVLDLCAAPGGKTVQIAAGMKNQGLLVANDSNSERVKGLVKNVELYGIRNAIVTNDTPDRLSKNFKNYFDKILVDAPCSGEGMLRKDSEAAKGMVSFTSEKCAGMQWEIMKYIDTMLKVGGKIVYSTCTFSPEENERIISRFLKENTNFELLDIYKTAGIEDGRPNWSNNNPMLKRTARLWPHKLEGEGHYVALLRKTSEITKQDDTKAMPQERNINLVRDKDQHDKCLKAYTFCENENLIIQTKGNFYLKGSNLYNLPVAYPDLTGIRVAKFGWYLGDFNYDKFEPSHSLIISLDSKDIKKTLNFKADSRELFSFLKGETLIIEGDKGYTGICVDGYTLGLAKQTGDYLKNLYPKGWRKLN